MLNVRKILVNVSIIPEWRAIFLNKPPKLKNYKGKDWYDSDIKHSTSLSLLFT